MASTEIHTIARAPGPISRFFARLMDGMENHMRIASRRDLIETLEAKSDEELADLGIKRDRIAQYVFRDMFYA